MTLIDKIGTVVKGSMKTEVRIIGVKVKDQIGQKVRTMIQGQGIRGQKVNIITTDQVTILMTEGILGMVMGLGVRTTIVGAGIQVRIMMTGQRGRTVMIDQDLKIIKTRTIRIKVIVKKVTVNHRKKRTISP
jgi:hypothetical protein